MVVGSLAKYFLYGIVAIFTLQALGNPQKAYAATQAFGGIGSALGSLGAGVQSFLTGTGTGAAQLLNPLWTLKDLIYGPQAGKQVTKDVQEISSVQDPFYQIPQKQTYEAIEAVPNILSSGSQQVSGYNFRVRSGFGAAPVASARVHGHVLPLSQQAINYYRKIGVEVTPSNEATVQANNSSNATSPTSHYSTAPVISSSQLVHSAAGLPPRPFGEGFSPAVTAGTGITGEVGSRVVSTRGGSPAAAAAASSLRAAAAAHRAL